MKDYFTIGLWIISEPILASASPTIGIVFFAIAYFIWSKGIDSYAGTGS